MSTPTSVPGTCIHLRPNQPTTYPTEKDEERRCDTCNARVTQTSSMGEVGHKYGCPERPDRLPNGSGSGASYYTGGEQ